VQDQSSGEPLISPGLSLNSSFLSLLKPENENLPDNFSLAVGEFGQIAQAFNLPVVGSNPFGPSYEQQLVKLKFPVNGV